VREQPGIQCLPVEQPDGRHDAFQPVVADGGKGTHGIIRARVTAKLRCAKLEENFPCSEIGHHIRSDKFIRDVDEGEISGSDVFLVFFCLDEVLVTADSIVRSLEEYVEEMSGRSGRKSNHYALAAGGRIREQLQAQSIQLRRLRNLLRKNLDSSSDIWHKSPLSQMVDRKGSRISRILHAISLEGGVSYRSIRSHQQTNRN
jgi:hypothetical protein